MSTKDGLNRSEALGSIKNMKDSLNESDIIGSIRLQLKHPSGADKVWILVEGETDQKLFSKWIDVPRVKIEISYGGVNSMLRTVLELLKETDRVLAIRDADFLHLERKKKETIKNVFLTDYHDVEMMVIACDKAYYEVAATYFRPEEMFTLREKFFKFIAFIGGLRWINDSDNLELNFKNLSFGNFYDGKSFDLDEEKFLQEIMKRSPQKKREVTKENVVEKIKDIFDFFNLCNGHDFQKVFAFSVNIFLKNNKVSEEEIGRAFRGGYRFEDFQKTVLYSQLKAWSDDHAKTLFRNV